VEQRRSSALSLTSISVGVQRYSPAVLPLGKITAPMVQGAGWAPGLVWKGAAISPI